MKAIIFIDVQKDFIDGALKNEQAIEITPKIVEFAKKYINNSDFKFYATMDTHKKTVFADIHKLDGTVERNVPWSGYLTTLEGKKLPVEHCITDTDGWYIDSRLSEVIDGKCTVITKSTFGSINGLEKVIAEDFSGKDFDEIVICGFVSSICVLSNAVILRAMFPDVKITVIEDLCCGVGNDDHDAAMKVLRMQQIEVLPYEKYTANKDW